MKKILLLLLLAGAGVALYYFFVTKPKPNLEIPRQQPLAVSKHSAGFNGSVGQFLNNYYSVSEALVNWDSTTATTQAAALQKSLDSVRFDELKQDTAIHQTAVSYVSMFQNDLSTIADNKTGLLQKRQAFNAFSQNLYDLLRTIKYDDQKVYLQECTMAFNDTETGIWLSKTSDIRNPYLGVHHPKYKSGMLSCGETKDTLNFKTL